MAKENGLCMLTFPPHCSHRLQPLDVSVFGPFKRFYASISQNWLVSHPSSIISIYNVADFSAQAFCKAFTMANITSGFKATGIFPFNSNIFSDDAFLPSVVTERPQCETVDDNEPCSSSTCLDVSSSDNPSSSQDLDTLLDLRPYPKSDRRNTTKSKRNRVRSSIITNTPEKTKLARPRRPNRAKPSRQQLLTSSSDDDDDIMSLHSHDASVEDSESDECEPLLPQNKTIGSYAIIKVYSQDKNHHNFIGILTAGPDNDGEYEVKFLKKSEKIKQGYIFPDNEDVASVSNEDILCILPDPRPVANTKRLSSVLKFDTDLSSYDM